MQLSFSPKYPHLQPTTSPFPSVSPKYLTSESLFPNPTFSLPLNSLPPSYPFSKEMSRPRAITFDEKHIVLSALVPGINVRRMSHTQYLQVRGQARKRIIRKTNSQEVVSQSVLPKVKKTSSVTTPLWSRKLNDVRRFILRFDRVHLIPLRKSL